MIIQEMMADLYIGLDILMPCSVFKNPICSSVDSKLSGIGAAFVVKAKSELYMKPSFSCMEYAFYNIIILLSLSHAAKNRLIQSLARRFCHTVPGFPGSLSSPVPVQ